MYYGAEIANRTTAQRTVQVGTAANKSAVGNASGLDADVLPGRKYVQLWNMSGKACFYSYSSSLASTNVVSKASGPIADGEVVILPVGPNLLVYLVCQTGSATISITEIA